MDPLSVQLMSDIDSCQSKDKLDVLDSIDVFKSPDLENSMEIFLRLITGQGESTFKLAKIFECETQIILKYRREDGQVGCVLPQSDECDQELQLEHQVYRSVDVLGEKEPQVVKVQQTYTCCSTQNRKDIVVGDDKHNTSCHVKEAQDCENVTDSSPSASESHRAADVTCALQTEESRGTTVSQQNVSQLSALVKEFKCQTCKKTFWTEHGLEVHRKHHLRESSFTRTCCNRKFDTIQSLIEHQKSHGFSKSTHLETFRQLKMKQSSSCNEIRSICTKSQIVKNHSLNCEIAKRFDGDKDKTPKYCPICDKACSSYLALQTHMQISHNVFSDENKLDKETNSSQLNTSKRVVSKGKECHEAETSEPTSSDIVKPLDALQKSNEHNECLNDMNNEATIVKTSLRKMPRRRHFCTQCGKSFQAARLLQLHKTIQGCSGTQDHKCGICDKAFSQEEQDKHDKHPKSVTRFRKIKSVPCIKCPHCPKKFKYSAELKVHMRKHTGERPFMCHYCGKCFASSSGRRIHEENHSGQRPYSCPVCNKTFTLLESLKRHKMIHVRQGKPFLCPTCGNRFSTSKSLYVHSKLHSGIRPYVCDVCGKAYTRPDTLRYHMQGHLKRQDAGATTCNNTSIMYTGDQRECQTSILTRGQDLEHPTPFTYIGDQGHPNVMAQLFLENM